MSTKEEILAILKKNGTRFTSGQEMASSLYMTRAAVWKGIKALEKEGYPIEAVTNRGYRLREGVAGLDAASIESLIGTDRPIEIFAYDEVGSTNDEALSFARSNPGKEAVFIAGRQTNGRGRRGREFYSPKGTGLYMTFLIYPHKSFEEAAGYTCLTAVALSEAIESSLGVKTGIKWVNDLYLEGKKVAGILTEGIASMEDQSLSHVVIGAGINIYDPYEGFPGKIKDVAGFLLKEPIDGDPRVMLAAAFIDRFFERLSEDKEAFIDEYIERSILTGSYVRVETFAENVRPRYAKVLGIDRECRLLVEYEDGKQEALSNGEVSVKKY